MVITSDKITVTHSMMAKANMIRGTELAVPYDFTTTPPRTRWMHVFEMNDEDFDNIEKYFLLKEQNQ